MTEFVMGPSVAPALDLVALMSHPKNLALYGSQDDCNGSYLSSDENMTCLTNLADSGGCQWGPVRACRWMKPSEKSNKLSSKNHNGLEDLYCAFAEDPEQRLLNDEKSYWGIESKTGDADDLTVHNEVLRSFHIDVDVRITGGKLKDDTAVDHEEVYDIGKNQCVSYDHQKEVYDQHSPECTTKSHAEKVGWRNVGRHAENRRKRWAQADPLLDIWKAVSASRYAAPFRRPVALLEDYDTIVRQPMDLSTIRRQLENDESYSLESLRRDLMLMVTNALVYNRKGSETYEMAVKLRVHATKLFEAHQKEVGCTHQKLSPSGSASKLVVKTSRAKQCNERILEPQTGPDSLPFVPIKKHRTIRRPRACIGNDAGGSRSDVSSGAAMDSSSEEEAAAVLVCFSSGQQGDEKQALPMSKVVKLESPRKRLKKVEMDTNDNDSSKCQEEGAHGRRRSERTCMGLKHKWQERWRIQSAESSENSDSLQQLNDQIAIKPFGDKYVMEGGSGGEANFRPFPQTAGGCSSIATSGVVGIYFCQNASPVSG